MEGMLWTVERAGGQQAANGGQGRAAQPVHASPERAALLAAALLLTSLHSSPARQCTAAAHAGEQGEQVSLASKSLPPPLRFTILQQ